MKYILSLVLFFFFFGFIKAQTNLWKGVLDATQEWKSITIESTKFQNIKEGQILRLYITDIKWNAKLTIMDSKNKEIDSYEYVNLSSNYATYQEYTIDDILLNTFINHGLCVNGWGYKLTSIDIITPDNFNVVNGYILNVDNWILKQDSPNLTIRLINPTSNPQSANIKATIKTDKDESYSVIEKTINIGANENITASIPFSAAPGFYTVNTQINGSKVYTGRALSSGKRNSSFTFGVQPESIVSNPDKQADFNQFWDNTLEELSLIEPNYKLTEIPSKSTSKRKVFLLEFCSLKDKGDTAVVVRGYYAEPTGVGKYPCIIHNQGYDEQNPTDLPMFLYGNDNLEFAELLLSVRGQGINNRSPYKNNYGDWFVYGLENKKDYYYRGAYMDAVRALDFLTTREHIDIDNIFAEGESQGGALTIAAAALGNVKLKSIAPAIPFMGDFPDYFKIASWPADIAKEARTKLGITEKQMYETLSYFDTKNLASYISSPVIESIGLQDKTCPPHINMAFYNNLPKSTEKQILYNSLLQHLTPANWENIYTEFFKDHFGNTTYTYEMSTAEWGTLCFPLSAPIPNGLIVYQISSINYDNNTVMLNQVQQIEANKPYIANGKAGTYVFSGTAYRDYEKPSLNNGLLKGTYEKIQLNSEKQFVLQSHNGNIGFYKTSSTVTIPSYKAYLELPDNYSAKSPAFLFEEQASSINIEKTETSNSIKYNIWGQRINSNQKEIHIIIDNRGNKIIKRN